MIIDAHTHPPTSRNEWPAFLDTLRHYRIHYAITSCLHADWPPFPTPEQVREANALAAEFSEFSGRTVWWLAYLNPHHRNWSEELERCLAAGACGIKLWISLRDPKGQNLERCYPILERAGRQGLPVLIHSANRTESKFPGELNTGDVVDLARRFPDTTVIEAHAGSHWRRGLGLRNDLRNLVVDLSAYLPEKDEAEEIVRDMGADRVLFGSDAAVRDIGSQLAKVFFSNLSDEVKEKILWKNAARVFRFPPPAAGEPGAIAVPGPLALPGFPDPSSEHFCFCGRWPFFPGEVAVAELERLLAAQGILNAFVAPGDGMYSENLARTNAAFAQATSGLSRVVPLAVLDPSWPNWPGVLDVALPPFHGGWISPYFHNYRLDAPECDRFFRACADAQFPLWINCDCGDARWRHRGVTPRPVATEELLRFGERAPRNQYVFQGVGREALDAFLSGGYLKQAARFEISRLTDFTGHLAAIVKKHGVENLVFGSEFPLRHLFTTRWVASEALALSKARR